MDERGLLYSLPSHNEHVYLKNGTSNVLCSLQVGPGSIMQFVNNIALGSKIRDSKDSY